MNIRKEVDYSEMYAMIDVAMAEKGNQMALYYAIGRAVHIRSKKGAAVAAAEYIIANYPNTSGFSPRNVRRMRDFYRAYEKKPFLLSLAMRLSWTQNVVILEADLTMQERDWYLQAAKRFGWSKLELLAMIQSQAHLTMTLDDKEANDKHYRRRNIWNVIQLIWHPHIPFHCRGWPFARGQPNNLLTITC